MKLSQLTLAENLDGYLFLITDEISKRIEQIDFNN